MKDANYTVEAVFVISICIWVLFALMYGSFYIHDRVILGSLTNENIAERFERGDKTVNAEWENEVKVNLGKQLFLMQIHQVKAKKSPASVKVQVQYHLPVSMSGIKALFSDSKNGDTYVTVKELTKPVEYKWDADLLREK